MHFLRSYQWQIVNAFKPSQARYQGWGCPSLFLSDCSPFPLLECSMDLWITWHLLFPLPLPSSQSSTAPCSRQATRTVIWCLPFLLPTLHSGYSSYLSPIQPTTTFVFFENLRCKRKHTQRTRKGARRVPTEAKNAWLLGRQICRGSPPLRTYLFVFRKSVSEQVTICIAPTGGQTPSQPKGRISTQLAKELTDSVFEIVSSAVISIMVN